MEATALIEYSHRLAVFLLGLFGVAVVVLAWLRFRSVSSIFRPAMLAIGVVAAQAWVGRLVVLHELPGNLVALHLSIALALLGVLTVMTVNSFVPRGGFLDPVARLALLATGTVFVALMAGALVSQSGAALVFPDWPLMNGRLLPSPDSSPQVVHFAHRLAALAAGGAIFTLAVRISKHRREQALMVPLARAAMALWVLQVIAGGATVLLGSPAWTIVVHVLLASLLWVTTVALTVLAFRRAPAPAPSKPASRLRAYVALTKPRIIELLLITTVPSMIVAAGELPPLGLMLATVLGGTLAAGSANAINCYFDRDIDARMKRTSRRPLPQHEIEPPAALRFGIVLGIVGISLLVLTVNALAALLALGAILFYVFVYTLKLKRTTPSNIVIGGAAGAVPVLVGWAAVTGKLEVPALVMSAVIFYWTPPHFWALSLRYASDYRAAGVPMLPVVRGSEETSRQILLYSLALLGVSLFLFAAGGLGLVYLAAALILGVALVGYGVSLRRRPDTRSAMALFRFSIIYLTLLFVAMGTDRLVDASAPVTFYPAVGAAAAALFLAAQSAIFLTAVRGRSYSQEKVAVAPSMAPPAQATMTPKAGVGKPV